MKVSTKFIVVGVVAAFSSSLVAQGVTFDELAAHIAKTNPTYQSIELQPKQAELRYNAVAAADWQLSVQSGIGQDTSKNGSDSRSEYKNWNGGFGLDRYSQTTGINFGLGYNYYRHISASRYSSSPESRYTSYVSNLRTSVRAPLWLNSLGYISRRSLQQDEIRLEAERLSYLSDRQSFMSRTQQEFTALCSIVAAESLTLDAYQRAATLANAAKKYDGSDVARSIPHAARFERELAASLKSTQRAREALQSDLAIKFDYPRLRAELPSCNMEQRFTYATSDAEIEKLVGAARSMQALAFGDRSLELSKEIVYNMANPRLDLSASYSLSGFDDDEWDKSLDEDQRGYSVNLNFNYPIGNTQARIRMDMVDLDRIRFENTKREITLGILADLRRHVLELQDLEKEIELHQQQVEAATTAREQDARLAVGNGRVDISLYEDAIRKELDAQFSLLVSKRDYQFAYVNYQNTVSNGASVPVSPVPAPTPISVPRVINGNVFW